MYTLPPIITIDSLQQYASYLYGRINEASFLTFKHVSMNGQAPTPKNCNENARFFVASDSSYKIVYGWICVDGGNASPSIDFIAHSVIQDSNGQLYEITPVLSIMPRPFLSSELDEHNFADIVNTLESLSGKATLVYQKQ